MTDNVISLFLVDDHRAVLEGLMALVGPYPYIRVVGSCENGLEVIGKARVAKPDVLTLDISLPGLNGLDICRLARQAMPETAVLMLTMHESEQCILVALRNGALGYLVKESAPVEFCDAVRAVSRGKLYLGRGMPASILKRVGLGEPGESPDFPGVREHG